MAAVILGILRRDKTLSYKTTTVAASPREITSLAYNKAKAIKLTVPAKREAMRITGLFVSSF